MEKLSPLQQEVLEFLKQLADFCERAELQENNIKEVKRKGYLKILVNDIDSYQALKKIEDLYDVSAYLQREGLVFTTTADLVNQDDDPDPFYPGHFELGRIEGKSIDEIRGKITTIIRELDKKAQNDNEVSTNKVTAAIVISFDSKLCALKCGDKTYKPRKKDARCKILKALWKVRRIKDLNGKVKKEGSPVSIEELAVAGGFIDQEDHFNQTTDRSVRDAIQDLRDKIDEIGFPATIDVNSGFLLSVSQ